MGKVLRAIDLGCAAVLLSLLSGAAAQASTIDLLPGSRGFVHEVFTTGDGLPAAGISQLLQTRDGFLWLATFDGLARFDGAHFEVFDSERVPALGSNRIFNLAEGRDSALWIRTEQGHLIRYANGIFAACPAPRAGRADCSLRQVGAPGYTLLQKDRSGALWAGGPGPTAWNGSSSLPASAPWASPRSPLTTTARSGSPRPRRSDASAAGPSCPRSPAAGRWAKTPEAESGSRFQDG